MTVPRSTPPASERAGTASADSSGPQRGGGSDAWQRPGIDGLRAVMDHLLGPQGCAWDRKQTLESLRPYLLEEAYEVLDAMDHPASHRDELGDLLLQIVFQSALRQKAGDFDLDDVADSIRKKMIRRHPHVFARDPGGKPLSPEEVAAQWESIKREERKERGEDSSNPFASVPRAMPPLQRAWRIQEKAAALGFDWPDLQGPIAKLDEEWAELRAAIEEGDAKEIRAELGDVLFVLVRLAQKLGVEAKEALGDANEKFERRFSHVLRRCEQESQDPAKVGLEQLDRYWDEAKALEKQGS